MAKIATLTSTFTTADTGLWNYGSTGVSQSSGKAHLNGVDYNNGYISSWASYDLTSSEIVFKFDAVPSTAANDGPFFIMQVQDQWPDAHTGNRIAWYYDPASAGAGTLKPRTITSGGTISDDAAGYITWAGTPLYLKIADNGTQIVWSSSTDGTTFTTKRTITRPAGFTLTAMYATMFATNNGAETGSFDIDSVNGSTAVTQAAVGALGITAAMISSAAGVVQAATAALAVTAAPVAAATGGSSTTAALYDLFETANDTGKWTYFGGATNTGGQLSIPATGWGFADNGVQSIGSYNLTSSSIIFDTASLATPNPESILELGFSSTAIDGTENRVLFSIYHTTPTAANVQVRWRVGGVDSTDVTELVLPRARYLRIRHVAPNLVFDTSADASTWSTAVTKATSELFTITSVKVWAITKGTATGSYTLNAINPSSVPVNTAPTAPQTFAASDGELQSVLTWTAPASNGGSAVTGYEITRSGSSTTVTLAAGVTTYTATGLTAGTVYTFSIKARNAVGLSAAATDTATPTAPVPTGPPGAPTAVTATAGNATAVVSWTAPSVTNGTIRDYSIVDHNGVSRATGITGTSTTVAGLTNGQQYTFRVSARNDSGSSALSVASNSVTPVAVTPDASLYLRSTLGAAGGTSYAALETAIGQALQPVVHYVNLSDTTASIASKVSAAADRGRRCLLMLGIATFQSSSIQSGGADARLSALATALAGTGQPVFVAPMYEGNDWKMPWSPYYGATSPTFQQFDGCGITSVADYLRTLDRVVRVLRVGAPGVRFVWSASVEDQPGTLADDWASFYPGPLCDVIMLKGFNYGNGPAQGGGNTVWQTAAEIFDTPYTTAAALHATKPIWLFTGCHEPATVYSPVGPGFPAGASIPADTTYSKGTWLSALMTSASWPRVTSVSLYSIANTRNWPVTSSAASIAAVAVSGGSTWSLTQVAQDKMGDYVRDSTERFATWLRSGSSPATRVNEYARPDKAVAGGVRGSLVFGVPYSPGQKALVNVSVTDELAWNRVHGELLRQAARNGMQSWAFAAGSLAPTDPVVLYNGTVTNSRTTLSSSLDAEPGPKMQVEGGMKAAEGGVIPVSLVPAPDFTFPTIFSGEYTDETTQIAVAWTPLTTAQLTGFTLSGYRFGYITTDPAETDPTFASAVYPTTTAPNPFVFTTLVPGVEYDIYVEAVMSDGQTGRTTKKKPTKPGNANQPPSAPTNFTVSNLTTTGADLSWTPPSNVGSSAITGYHVSRDNPYWDTKVDTDGVTPLPEPTRTYNLTNFVVGQTYTFTVWAVNAAGEGAKSQKTLTLAAPDPGQTNPALQGFPTGTRLAGAYVYGNDNDFNGLNSNWNLLFAFAATRDAAGDGHFTWTRNNPANLVAARAAGKRVIASVGGAFNHHTFTSRAQSTRCVQSFVDMNTKFGGTLTNPVIDGADFNCFESSALDTNTAFQIQEYIWMGQELKRLFGSNFLVHAPPAPWHEQSKDLCRAALAAGAFDFVSPQYYDGGNATYYNINDNPGSGVPYWINNVAAGNASKIAVGYGLDYPGDGPPNYMYVADIDASWVNLESRFPSLRGAWIWRSDFDSLYNSNGFGDTVCPKIRSL